MFRTHQALETRDKPRRESSGERVHSFKKLMAANRANLVPRLAISTILNEHINEVLVDHRQQQSIQASPPLQ